MKTSIALILLALCCGCSTSSTPEGGEEQASTGDKRECRAVGGGTGSRMRQSVCRTAEEWALADAEAKEREDIQSEFFRRVGENASQTQAPAFDSAGGAGL
jgi:hypothetical protein